MAEPDERLDAELRALGRTLVVAAPTENLVEQVLTRLPTNPPPDRRPSRREGRTRRRRLVAAVVTLLIIGLGLTPSVRAAVVEWLRVGGVLIRTEPPVAGAPSPTPSPPPTIGPRVTLAEARSLVDFPVGVPTTLGPPDRIAVSADRRIVAMDWGAGADQLHLDQFDGTLSWLFIKTTRDPFEVTSVDGQDAIWFPTAHAIGYVDRDGRERTEQARIAGPCLVWERTVDGRRVTMRLEGRQSLADAVIAAESIR